MKSLYHLNTASASDSGFVCLILSGEKVFIECLNRKKNKSWLCYIKVSRKWISLLWRTADYIQQSRRVAVARSVVDSEVEEERGDLSTGETSLIVIDWLEVVGVEGGEVGNVSHESGELGIRTNQLSGNGLSNERGVQVRDQRNVIKECSEVAEPIR